MIGKTLAHYQIIHLCRIAFRTVYCFLFAAAGAGASDFLTISAPGWEQESSPSTLKVTKLADTNDGTCDGDCSLREALAAAALNDTVEFASGLRGTIILESTLNITKNVTLNGPSTSSIAISGNNAIRVLHVSTGIEFKIRNLTIARGRVKGEPGAPGKPGQSGSVGAAAKGGGLYNDGGIVAILNCTFWDNRAIGGPGGNGGFGTARFVTDTNKSATARSLTDPGSGGKGGDGMGGGLYNAGTVFLVNSTFSGNKAIGGRGGDFGSSISEKRNPLLDITGGDGGNGYGGAIYSFSGLWISNCTLLDNGASGGTGGFFSEDGNSRSGARGIGSGAALYRAGVIPTGKTVAVNRSQAPVVKNTLILNSSSGSNCEGAIESRGYNIDSDGTCSLLAIGDISKISLKLGPLKNNGGTTFTHALPPDSPAIDAGNPAGCTDHLGAAISTDQRGRSRPWGKRCDIGAFEYSRQ